MAGYLIGRLGQLVSMLFAISLLVFGLTLFLPEGPLAQFAVEPSMSAADLADLSRYYGLDQPPPTRYLRWAGALLRGDLGTSYATHQPVATLIGERLPNTLLLQSISLLASLVIAIPVGALAATRPHSPFDYLASALTSLGHAIPPFWSSLLAIMFFAVQLRSWGWPALPATGMVSLGPGGGSLVDRAAHLVLPVAVLALFNASHYSRQIRGAMLDVLRQDYLRTAHAKGLSERAVLLRHALRNAALPVVTVLALDLPNLFSGAVVVESVFAWPGMGRLFVESALRFDYPALMALAMLVALLVSLSMLFCDVVYMLLDPRVSLK
jgi:peptide/nickel transport system permease protein